MSDKTGHDITEFGMEPREPCTLYLISPPQIDLPVFAKTLADALTGGPVACFQLRLKGLPDADIIKAAKALKPILDDHDAALIINDSARIAAEVDADAVHLGQSDGRIKDARDLLGFDKAIGVTCHNSRHLALEAGEQGADYVAFGAFFPSRTKEPPVMADLEILSWWTALVELPCVAIGGITVENCGQTIAAGADMIAASGGVWAYEKGPRQAIADFNAVLARQDELKKNG